MKLIPNSVSVKLARQALIAQKNSPAMLFVGGVVGVAASTVLACRATLKLEEVIENSKAYLQMARGLDAPDQYTEADRQKDIAIIYTRSAIQVVKLYAPAAVVGFASVGALTMSHRILNQRNIALTAAYAAVDEAFKSYRGKVIEKYGEEEDRKLRYELEEYEYENSKGKLKTALRPSPEAESQYARFFDELSPEWSKEPEYNLAFLRSQQNYWNDILRSRGHVFLNEVYKSLGIDHSQPGAIVGWIIGPNGDNYIDFGVFRNEEKVRDFVNGREGAILLDFNVDGVIFDKLGTRDYEAIAWQS